MTEAIQVANEICHESRGTAPLVTFRDVSFSYSDDGPKVLEGVTFDIFEGEVVTLLGPSGCGKSTLLKMVAGLVYPNSGQCSFAGDSIRIINTRVGYMTQEDTLLPWRTVRSNVGLPLKLKGVPRHEIQVRVAQHLEMVQLSDAADKFPAQLSGGMKRRALLARSVITEPSMILMDEPFAAIDADLREGLQAEVRATVDALSQTVLFVTHDVGEAAILSDRVIVIGGKPSATVVDTIMVPFGRDRDLAALQTSDEFFRIQKALRAALTRAGEDSR